MSTATVKIALEVAGAEQVVDELRARLELAAWRRAGGPLLVLVERVLAAQGDAAEPELIHLQHLLATLCGTARRAAAFSAGGPVPSVSATPTSTHQQS